MQKEKLRLELQNSCLMVKNDNLCERLGTILIFKEAVHSRAFKTPQCVWMEFIIFFSVLQYLNDISSAKIIVKSL